MFDNEVLHTPYRKMAVFEHGKSVYQAASLPKWLVSLLPKT